MDEVFKALETLQKWYDDGIAATPEMLEYIKDVQNRVVPLAEELGLSKEQYQIADLTLKVGYPDDYKQIKKLLFDSELMCENVFKTFALPIRSMLDSLGIDYDFKYRMKSVYSIWRKMTIDHKYFDDVYDLFATRIVYRPKSQATPLADYESNIVDQVDTAAAVKADTMSQIDPEILECWRIYTVISTLYRIHPDRIRDWITHPKKSGYQALQLTVMGPDCNWIEIQVRSERMDYEAEHGSASHANYKREAQLA